MAFDFKKEFLLRGTLFLLGLFFSGLGVACTKYGALGVSPISSVPNILNIRFPALSIGNWLILWNCLLIVGQVLIYRRRFQLFQLLQIPLSFLFGWFTDFGMWCLAFFPIEAYAVRLFLVFFGTALLGFGISLAVIANLIMNSGEAFVKALSDALHKEFGNIKIAFDITCVLLSILLSMLFFRGAVLGTREGTLIAALCTGITVKWFCKRLQPPLTRLFSATAG